jgi:hypothetical protein
MVMSLVEVGLQPAFGRIPFDTMGVDERLVASGEHAVIGALDDDHMDNWTMTIGQLTIGQ